MTHLASIGITRIAFVHADDSFGEDGVAGAKKGLTSVKLTAIAIEKFDRTQNHQGRGASGTDRGLQRSRCRCHQGIARSK